MLHCGPDVGAFLYDLGSIGRGIIGLKRADWACSLIQLRGCPKRHHIERCTGITATHDDPVNVPLKLAFWC